MQPWNEKSSGQQGGKTAWLCSLLVSSSERSGGRSDPQPLTAAAVRRSEWSCQWNSFHPKHAKLNPTSPLLCQNKMYRCETTSCDVGIQVVDLNSFLNIEKQPNDKDISVHFTRHFGKWPLNSSNNEEENQLAQTWNCLKSKAPLMFRGFVNLTGSLLVYNEWQLHRNNKRRLLLIEP